MNNIKPQQLHSSFPSIQEFQGDGIRQNIPLTGETSTATSQVMFNPGFSFSPTPICFYPQPAVQPSFFRPSAVGSQMWAMQQASPGSMHPQFIPNRMQSAAGFMPAQPVTFGQYMQPFQFQTGGGFARTPGQQPVYCTYLPDSSAPTVAAAAATAQNPSQMSGVPQRTQTTATADNRSYNIPTDSDIIYASYPNQMAAFRNRSGDQQPIAEAAAVAANVCPPDHISCLTTAQCVPRAKWCNADVDCLDSSDETACSCKSRLAPERICDGYMDCPMGSDELGCFGCDKFAYSCHASAAEAVTRGESELQACYSTVDRCDGTENCLNGRDERDCSMLVRTVGEHLSYMVAYSEGYLHRNFKGKWYPVCSRPERWAAEACRAETGNALSAAAPSLSYRQAALPSQFLQPAASATVNDLLAEPEFSDHCTVDGTAVLLHAKCPPMQCGRMTQLETMKSMLRIRVPGEQGDKLYAGQRRKERAEVADEQLSIVGGETAEPMNWPFVVGMYQDGSFHCGGVIYADVWVGMLWL